MTLTRIGLGSRPVPLPVRPPRSGFPPDTLFPFFSLTLAILAAPRQLHVDMEQVPIVHPIPALPLTECTRAAKPGSPAPWARCVSVASVAIGLLIWICTPACGVAETSNDTGAPGACRRAFVNPSWIAR